MKKLLIIDDKPSKQHENGQTVFLADLWKKRVEELSSDVEVAKYPNSYFNWDPAGNYCNPLFNIDDYAFVFIHHSQKNDSLFPSNIIDLIKCDLGEKLILFSGQIEEHFLNSTNEIFIFRSISRDKLWRNFPEFLKKSKLLDEWVLEILYYDIDDYLIKAIINMQENYTPNEDIINSPEFKKLLCLKHVDNATIAHSQLVQLEGVKLITMLRSL